MTPATAPALPPAVFGEVLFDCFADGARVLGGAPFNVAWHLQGLGASPVLISAVGEDAMGDAVAASMARWGMSRAGLQRTPGHATGEVRVSLAAGQPEFDILDARAFDHVRAADLPRIPFSMIYHGTLALRHAQSAAALDALIEASGAPVFLDLNLRTPWWNTARIDACMRRARWVKLNHEELAVLDGGGGGHAARAQRVRERFGLELLIVTLAEDGALALGEDGEQLRVPALPAPQVVDTVGAGDGFAAVCMLALALRWPRASMLERASAFAARIVAQRGATAEHPQLYRALLEHWHAAAG